MAYQVLARKWRPLTFEEVVNQTHVKTTLINAVHQNRIAHAYIFAGPRGVGKTTVARILARALNCKEGPTSTPCNECVSCTEIIEDRSMDVMEIDGASNRGIEDVRNIRENIKYSPVHGKYRIYIIDEVHMLTREAFNALLKTLEEPPSHVLFIFATTEYQKIPQTILSRCQRFDFKRLALKEIVEQIEKICKEESVSLTEDALITLVRRADGSLRDAESLLDQLIAFCGNTINAENVFEVLGLIKEDIFFSCTQGIINGDLNVAFRIAGQVFDEGYDPGEFLNGLLEHFRNILLIKISNNSDLIETSDNYKKEYLTTAKEFSEMDILRYINLITESEFSIKKSSQQLLRLELLLSRLIALEKSVTIDQILGYLEKRTIEPDIPDKNNAVKDDKKSIPDAQSKKNIPNSGSNNISNGYNEIPPKDYSEPPPETNETEKPLDNQSDEPSETDDRDQGDLNLSFEDFQGKWSDFIDAFQKRNSLIGTMFSEGTLLSYRNNTLEISFGSDKSLFIDSIQRSKEKVKSALGEFFGKNINFTCVKTQMSTEEKEAHMKKRIISSTQNLIRKIIEKEPIIQNIIDTFEGESLVVRTN